ncbi:MAG TPA: hypothetical protein VJQ79_01365, partial [Acidimicrobiia bacterium]|nr:hypothetical protein [Acidimicrobiia bacterium]
VIAGNDDAIRAASTVAGALAEAAREGRELAGKKTVPSKGDKARDDAAPMKAPVPAAAAAVAAPMEAAPPEPAREPEPPAAVEAELAAVAEEPPANGDPGEESATNG